MTLRARWAGLLSVLVVFTADGAAAGDATVSTIDLVLCNHRVVPESLWHAVVGEANAVLTDANIVLRSEIAKAGDCAGAEGHRVLVRIEAPRRWPGAAVPPAGIGRIQFRGGEPGSVITLSVWAASHLIRADPRVSTLFERVGPRLREEWMGRMLGRALAHEIVHYVLRSPRHTATGLMRATHAVDKFVGKDRSAFRLSRPECDALLSQARALRQGDAAEKAAATIQ